MGVTGLAPGGRGSPDAPRFPAATAKGAAHETVRLVNVIARTNARGKDMKGAASWQRNRNGFLLAWNQCDVSVYQTIIFRHDRYHKTLVNIIVQVEGDKHRLPRNRSGLPTVAD